MDLTPQYRIEEYIKAIADGFAEATLEPYPEEPVWRLEEFLDAFITYIWEDGDHPRHPCPDPVWRLEECLRAIYDVMTGAATPWAFPLPTTNRIEEYLAAIHAYLADGTELPVPEPVWRIEQWLAYVLDAVKQGGGVEKTVSGSPAHITDALAKAALSVLASIEPIQSLHGYSHPWPAGGGVNKLNAEYTESITLSKTFLFDTPLPAGQYTFSFISADTSSQVASYQLGRYRDETGSYVYAAVNSTRGFATFTNTEPCSKIILYSNKAYNESTGFTTVFTGLMLKADGTGSYSPYSNICPISGRTGLSVYVGPTQDQQDATTYAVDWTSEAGTVYEGTLDVVTGVLTVDRAMVVIDGVNKTVRRNGTTSTISAAFFEGAVGKAYGISNFISDRFATAIGSAPGGMNGRNNSTGVEFLLPADIPNDNPSLNQWFADNPTQLCYELATPITYQLTPQEVQMLLGENYVWASSGDTVSVTYYAEGNANTLQSLNILLGGNYSNPKTADDVSDKEALDIILGGNK